MAQGKGHGSLLAVLCLALLASACGKDDHSSSSIRGNSATCLAGPNSNYAGLAYTVIGAGYTSSSLLYCDFQTGQQKELLTGESGNPSVHWLFDKLYFVNSAMSNLNYRSLDPRQNPVAVSKQLATPNATGAGDPSAMAAIDDSGTVAMGHLAASQLVIANLLTGETKQAFDLTSDDLDVVPTDYDPASNYDIPKEKLFYPQDLLVKTVADKTYLFVLHAYFKANGKNQVFVLEQSEDGQFHFVDQDPSQDKIQGIKTHFENAAKFLGSEREAPLIGALCTELSGVECESGIEQLDPQNMTVTTLTSLQSLHKVGDTMVVGEDDKTVYAKLFSNEKSDGTIVKLNFQGELTEEVIYTFPADSTLTGGFFFDPSTKKLFIGDLTTKGQASLTMMTTDRAESEKVSLGGFVGAGILIPSE